MKTLRIDEFASESGANLVEFALSIGIVLASIFAVLYCSMALYADHYVANAAKEAARYAMVRGSTWNGAACETTASVSCTATSTDITKFVESTLPPGLSVDDLTVNTTWPGTDATGAACDTTDVSTGSSSADNNPYCVVKVQVSYNFNFPLPLFSQKSLSLTSTSEVAISK